MAAIEEVLNKLGARWRGEQTKFRVNKMTYAEKQREHYVGALQIIRKELGL